MGNLPHSGSPPQRIPAQGFTHERELNKGDLANAIITINQLTLGYLVELEMFARKID